MDNHISDIYKITAISTIESRKQRTAELAAERKHSAGINAPALWSNGKNKVWRENPA